MRYKSQNLCAQQKEVPVTPMQWKRKVLTWTAGPAMLIVFAYGCAPVNHAHPDLGTDQKAVQDATAGARRAASNADRAASRAETAADKAERAASSANSAASRANTAASRAEVSASRAESAAGRAERAAAKAEAIFKKTLRK